MNSVQFQFLSHYIKTFGVSKSTQNFKVFVWKNGKVEFETSWAAQWLRNKSGKWTVKSRFFISPNFFILLSCFDWNYFQANGVLTKTSNWIMKKARDGFFSFQCITWNRCWRVRQVFDTCCSSSVSKKSDLCRVTSKMAYVLLYPLQDCNLIHDPIVWNLNNKKGVNDIFYPTWTNAS